MPAFTRLLFFRPRTGLVLTAVLAGFLTLQACAPITAVRGNAPDPDRLAELEPGHHKRTDVIDTIGSPSSVSAFKPETWLYISRRIETLAFMKPEVKESKVIALKFDEAGVFQNIEELNLDDMKNVELVERSTPTAGNEVGVLEQLIGNFGRFNKESGGQE